MSLERKPGSLEDVAEKTLRDAAAKEPVEEPQNQSPLVQTIADVLKRTECPLCKTGFMEDHGRNETGEMVVKCSNLSCGWTGTAAS